MLRALALAIVLLAAVTGLAAQDLPALRFRVSVLDADRRPVPVARHALLISDNPATAAPRRVITSADGTAQLRVRPGSYTIESDRPFVLNGRSYEWTETVTVVAGRDTTLELTTANAVTGAAAAEVEKEAVAEAKVPVSRESVVLSAWQDSTFALWTPLAHAAGFLADERGLVATSLRAIGEAKTIEVQLSRTVKVAGAVVVADPSRDVAVIRVHPSTIAGFRPVPLACDASTAAAGQDRYAIEVPLSGSKDVTTDLVTSAGAAGGPVFGAGDRAIGLSSPADDADARMRIDIRVVGAQAVCEALTSARATLDAAAPPDAARLPVESERALPITDIKATAAAKGFSLNAYSMSSSDFDVTFITPVLLAGVDAQQERTQGRPDDAWGGLRAVSDFSNWSEYVMDAPPVLFVRVSPRLIEGFWMKFGRAAASTQGAQIPPIKRMRPGFLRMRVLCGGKELTPVHPFKIQTHITETEGVDEGFYAFDPGAIGPQCGTVSIVLSSLKQPDKTETRTVDPAIVKQLWQDFASYRAAADKH